MTNYSVDNQYCFLKNKFYKIKNYMLQNQQLQLELVQYQNSNFVPATPDHKIKNWQNYLIQMSNLEKLKLNFENWK